MAGFLPTNQANTEALLLKIALLLESIQTGTLSHGYFIPNSSTDAAAPDNSIYYSTTASKLVYKDSGGTVHNLY